MKNKSILIIGNGKTSFKINTIHQIKTDLSYALKMYEKGSPLANALETLTSFDDIDIFVANVFNTKDLINIFDMIRQFEFDYIVPVGIKFSDTTVNLSTGQSIYYTELFLHAIGTETDSILIMTDVHAELYEDIDHYLKTMSTKVNEFNQKSTSRIDEFRRQLWFVANHLKDVPYANVLLAAVCASAEPGQYPIYRFPTPIFDIDPHDVFNDMIYFKTNKHAYHSIENFVNFNLEQDVYKIAPIDLVIRHINKTIDLSDCVGKLYNNSAKLRIRSRLQESLNSMRGSVIRDYSIIDIRFELRDDYSYVVLCFFKIVPINSLEECKIVIEVG